MPPGLSVICSTSGVSETQIITRSLPAARAAGPAAAVAPAVSRGARRSGERFHTVTAWPLASRLRAMPPPMVPIPTKPMRSLMLASRVLGTRPP